MKTNVQKKRIFLPYLLLLPSLIILAMFVFYPFVKNIILSLTMTDVQGNIVKFVGFKNYARLFSNKTFLNSLSISFRFALIVGIPAFVIGFALALAATEQNGAAVFTKRCTPCLWSLPPLLPRSFGIWSLRPIPEC